MYEENYHWQSAWVSASWKSVTSFHVAFHLPANLLKMTHRITCFLQAIKINEVGCIYVKHWSKAG